MLLIEQVGRLSRLNDADWEPLKRELDTRDVHIVALDLPTSWRSIVTTDETTARILAAKNRMLLNRLAAIACKDYTDHRRRHFQGEGRVPTRGAERSQSVCLYWKWSEMQKVQGAAAEL